MSSLVPKLVAAEDPDGIVEVIASAVEFAVGHLVISKVLRDEGSLVGAFVVNEFKTLLRRLLLLAEPVVQRLDDLAGDTAVDVPILAEWVARVVMTMVLAPPGRPAQQFLGEVLRPMLARGSD